MPRAANRDYLARQLRQNWMSKFPDARTTPNPVAGNEKEIDDSLTNLNWLPNMNLMKMTSPNPPLSPPPHPPTHSTPSPVSAPQHHHNPQQNAPSNIPTQFASVQYFSHGFPVSNPPSTLSHQHQSASLRRAMSYDPFPISQDPGLTSGPNVLSANIYPETIEQLDEAEMSEYRRNSLAKPHFSYATLISMAMRAVNKNKVALTDIYDWIKDNFMYYKVAEPSWQNSIRHNLSQYKCFQKVPRRKDEMGKGGFWRFNPEYQRVMDSVVPKRRRQSATSNSSASGSIHSTGVSLPMSPGHPTTVYQHPHPGHYPVQGSLYNNSYYSPPKRQRSLYAKGTHINLNAVPTSDYPSQVNMQTHVDYLDSYQQMNGMHQTNYQSLPIMSSAFPSMSPSSHQQPSPGPLTHTNLGMAQHSAHYGDIFLPSTDPSCAPHQHQGMPHLSTYPHQIPAHLHQHQMNSPELPGDHHPDSTEDALGRGGGALISSGSLPPLTRSNMPHLSSAGYPQHQVRSNGTMGHMHHTSHDSQVNQNREAHTSNLQTTGGHTLHSLHANTTQHNDASAVLNDFLSGAASDYCDQGLTGHHIDSNGNLQPGDPSAKSAIDLTTQGDPLDLTIQGVGLKPPDWWSQSFGSSIGGVRGHMDASSHGVGHGLMAGRLEMSGNRSSLAPSPLLLEEDQQWVDEQLNLEELDTILGLT